MAIAAEAFEALGFAFREQHESDYGIDAHVELIVRERPTGRLLGVQIKSGPSYLAEAMDRGYVFREDDEHIDYWLQYCLPIVVCLVDMGSRRIYWQVVSRDTIERAVTRYKIVVPYEQRLESDSYTALCELLTPVIPRERYTIFRTRDASHASAKRYAFDVVLNGTLNRSEITAVVRAVTGEGARFRYYRSALVEDRWGDSDAHVVWTFVYPSAEDRARQNLICRSLWIDPELGEGARPIALEGEHIGDNVVIDWNLDYEEMGVFHAEATLSKRSYLDACLPAVEELAKRMEEFSGPLRLLAGSKIEEPEFLRLFGDSMKRIREVCRAAAHLGHAPYECKEVDVVFQCFTASLDNIAIYFSEKGLATWEPKNRYWLAVRQLESAEEELAALRYEAKKVLR